MGGRNFKSIKAWQFANDLAIAVYKATESFPPEEKYGLMTQMRRSAVSVAANIAEGGTRNSQKEYVQFLSIARGSLAELEYYLSLARQLNYVGEKEFSCLSDLHRQAARTLCGLLRYIEYALQPGVCAGSH
jgi:four helix bundle protein